ASVHHDGCFEERSSRNSADVSRTSAVNSATSRRRIRGCLRRNAGRGAAAWPHAPILERGDPPQRNKSVVSSECWLVGRHSCARLLRSTVPCDYHVVLR